MFVLVYNLKSKSIQSILYVFNMFKSKHLFVLLKFENNIACINYIYFQVYKY